MADAGLRRQGKVVAEFAKKTAVDVMRVGADARRPLTALDETALLQSAKDFLTSELGLEVSVYSADDQDKYDPQDKARVAVPGRPGIFLE